MPRFVPDTLFSDCWSSVGNVTYYHRNGVCYFRSKAYSEFAGTAEQLEQKGLHQRAIKAWKGLSSKGRIGGDVMLRVWLLIALLMGMGTVSAGITCLCRLIMDLLSWGMSTLLLRGGLRRFQYSVWISWVRRWCRCLM